MVVGVMDRCAMPPTGKAPASVGSPRGQGGRVPAELHRGPTGGYESRERQRDCSIGTVLQALMADPKYSSLDRCFSVRETVPMARHRRIECRPRGLADLEGAVRPGLVSESASSAVIVLIVTIARLSQTTVRLVGAGSAPGASGRIAAQQREREFGLTEDGSTATTQTAKLSLPNFAAERQFHETLPSPRLRVGKDGAVLVLAANRQPMMLARAP